MPAISVKICGLKRSEDVEHAVQAGADFLGFILAPNSPRALLLDEARQLVQVAQQAIQQTTLRQSKVLQSKAPKTVGVFQNQPLAFIQQAVAYCGFDWVQLHGNPEQELPEWLPQLSVPAIRAFSLPLSETAEALQARCKPYVLQASPQLACFLFDRPKGLSSKDQAQWLPAITPLLGNLPPERTGHVSYWLAGGLTPQNVAETLQAFSQNGPAGVDVVSGVEEKPGIQNPLLVESFIQTVRQTICKV